jgi:S1-C subfamily serine protease
MLNRQFTHEKDRLKMAQTLVDFSNALADAVTHAASRTVRVEARRRLPATGFAWESGLIVTAHHVVERDENIHIGLPNGETVEAVLIGRDPSTDVAVLKLKATQTGLDQFERVPFDALRVGHLALAVGRPGKEVLSTMGIVSALGRDATSRAGTLDFYVQTDVAMYPGFSGGPLISAAGHLIGMSTSAMGDTSLAIPTPTLTRVVEAIVKHGKVKLGYLGIGTQPVRLKDSYRTQFSQETGLLIMSVEDGSPADHGGLLQGDVIIHLAGRPARSMDDLAGGIAATGVGGSATVKVIRAGNAHDLSITVGERP